MPVDRAVVRGAGLTAWPADGRSTISPADPGTTLITARRVAKEDPRFNAAGSQLANADAGSEVPERGGVVTVAAQRDSQHVRCCGERPLVPAGLGVGSGAVGHGERDRVVTVFRRQRRGDGVGAG